MDHIYNKGIPFFTYSEHTWAFDVINYKHHRAIRIIQKYNSSSLEFNLWFPPVSSIHFAVKQFVHHVPNEDGLFHFSKEMTYPKSSFSVRIFWFLGRELGVGEWAYPKYFSKDAFWIGFFGNKITYTTFVEVDDNTNRTKTLRILRSKGEVCGRWK